MDFLKSYSIPLKLLYFIINIQYYAFYYFRGNFASVEFHIEKDNFGQIFGIILAICFFTNSFIATLNDKFERPKFFMVCLLVISLICFEMFYFIPEAKDHKWIFWGIMFMYSFFSTGLPALLDRFALEYLQRNPHTNVTTYGRQRLWGTVGYSIGNIMVESLCRKDTKFDFTNLKYYLPIVTVPAVLCTLWVVKSYGNQQRSTSDLEHSWSALLHNKEYVFFIFIIFLNGVTRAGMTIYLSIFLDEVLQLQSYDLSSKIPTFFANMINIFNNNPLSTTAMCGTILEILILFYSQNIVNSLGLYWPLLFAQIAQFARFAGYYILPYDHKHVFLYTCLFETIKGVNFGLTHSSGVQIANKLCPPHLKATSQMIYTGTFTGLASFFSGQIFGLLFSKTLKKKDAPIEERVSSFQSFFIVNMGINLVCILLFTAKYGFIDKTLSFDAFKDNRKKASQNQKKDEKVVKSG